MRTLTVMSILFLFILSTACTTTGDDITSPTGTDLLNTGKGMDNSVDECRANMRKIASACVIYYAINSTYPADMEQLGEPYSEITCPECGQPYNLKGNQEHLALNCPLPAFISHGNIVDGIASWIGEPGQGQDGCRANMRTIASQCVIFFATNDRYPTTMEEIGMAGVVCPGCGLDYQFIGTETEFFVGCPLPYDPTHGVIDDGVASW